MKTTAGVFYTVYVADAVTTSTWSSHCVDLIIYHSQCTVYITMDDLQQSLPIKVKLPCLCVVPIILPLPFSNIWRIGLKASHIIPQNVLHREFNLNTCHRIRASF